MYLRLVATTHHPGATTHHTVSSPASAVVRHSAVDPVRLQIPVDMMRRADAERWRVAVVGGSPAQREEFHTRMVAAWAGLALVGHWTPTHTAVASRDASFEIAQQIRHTEADLVVVCLGTRRGTEWVGAYGGLTGARALLTVEALGELLTDRVPRTPTGGARTRLDEMWRLVLEPKRWAKRDLVEGPPAFPAVRRSSAPHDA